MGPSHTLVPMIALKSLAALAVLYGGVVLAAVLAQRSLMYFPGPALPAPQEGFAAVTLATADGLALTSWYAAPATATHATIVYFQGNAGTIADRAGKVRPFLADGHGVLLVGYRGYGGNPGSPTEQGLLQDGRAAVRYVLDKGVSSDRVVLLGESLGCGIAVKMAVEWPVAALILEAPFTSAAAVGQAAYPYLPVKWLIKDRFDSLGAIDRVTSSVLVIHGEQDRVVPVSHGRRLLAAAPSPKEGRFLAGDGHNDLSAHGAIDHERAFLRRVLTAPGP